MKVASPKVAPALKTTYEECWHSTVGDARTKVAASFNLGGAAIDRYEQAQRKKFVAFGEAGLPAIFEFLRRSGLPPGKPRSNRGGRTR